jgi:hypothetical protein
MEQLPSGRGVPKVCAGKDPLTVRETGSKIRKTEGEAQIELGRMLVLARSGLQPGSHNSMPSRLAELLAQQHDVKCDDYCRAHSARDHGVALVDMTAHHVAPAGQDDKRHQREGDAE